MSTIVITGGSGFIGTNLAYRLLDMGHKVCLFDNLSRRHVVRNISWLMNVRGDRLNAEIADIRDRAALRRVLQRADHVFHLAAQVGVSSSIQDPRADFDINVGGTICLLEEIRCSPNHPSLIFTSTSKVYGALPRIPLRVSGKRYVRTDGKNTGIDESEPLKFDSPFACSKGTAEQYVLDYGKTFGIRTCVFRTSSIYGPHQLGTEDDGWVSYMMSRAMACKPITVYGDGRQVRDILFVEDLVDVLVLAQACIADIAGEAFNIGGGPENSVSLLEFVELLGKYTARPIVNFSGWRPGDQRYYVSDTRKFRTMTGWVSRVGIREGVERLHRWMLESDFVPQPVLRKAS